MHTRKIHTHREGRVQVGEGLGEGCKREEASGSGSRQAGAARPIIISHCLVPCLTPASRIPASLCLYGNACLYLSMQHLLQTFSFEFLSLK